MSIRILFFLFLLSLFGLFLGTYGDTDQVPEIKPRQAQESGLLKIPESVIRTFGRIFKRIFGKIYEYVRPVVRGITTLTMDFLGFLASSDDTRVARVRRGVSTKVAENQGNRARRGGVFSVFSRVFTLPFKVVGGGIRLIPFGSMFRGAMTTVETVMSNPVIMSATNQTIQVVEQATLEMWRYAKVNVFPSLDKWVTSMKQSNTIPQPIMKYLLELQSLYHVLHLFNLA